MACGRGGWRVYEIYGLLSRGGSRGSRVTVAKSASAVFSCAVMSRGCGGKEGAVEGADLGPEGEGIAGPTPTPNTRDA